MNSVDNIDKNRCCGCGACFNICPVGAISMNENNEGFLYPVIDENKCTNCGLCYKVCPTINSAHDNYKSPECYVVHSNDEVRMKSSSGGVFPIIADYFIENGGFVAGAVWTEDMHVKHIVSDKIEDIEKMKNSKYLQSDINNCYKEIKEILDDNKKVLFTGTPCQVEGLRLYLQKDYDNLYCVAIMCHGVPSQKVFEKYINEEKLSNENEQWLNTNFRDKIEGWNPNLITTTTTTTSTSRDYAKNDSYMQAFLKNLSLRKSCTNCVYRTIPLSADIMIGDAWKIDKYDKTLNDGKGLSAIMINNKKGENLFENIKQKFSLYKHVPLKFVLNGNSILKKSCITDNPNRKLFFELFNKKSLKECVDVCVHDKCDYLIVNYGWSWYNFGANLTAYAMQELIKSFGYTALNLLCFEKDKKSGYTYKFDEFAKRYLNFTQDYLLAEAGKVSKSCKGVVCGSDQVLRLSYIYNHLHKYLLNFVDTNCKKIALAASFGVTKDKFLKNKHSNAKNLNLMRMALKSFDYLSTRETSGIEIYKDVFGLDSDMILDPVFLIDKNKYEQICADSNKDFKNKVVTYVIDKDDPFLSVCNYLSGKYHYDVHNLDSCTEGVEDWLKAIKECKLLITDSFHGTCFALIFNKPFICLRNSNRGDARFKSIIDLLHIEDNFIFDIDEIYTKDINLLPDYASVNKILEDERIRCINIISKVLNDDYSNNPDSSKYKKLLNISLFLKINIFKYCIYYINYKKYKFLSKHGKSSKKEDYLKKKNKWRNKLIDIKYEI